MVLHVLACACVDSRIILLLTDMAAEAVCTDTRNRADAAKVFERLCSAGFSRRCLLSQQEDTELMLGMTKVRGLAFLPMHHLMPAFEALAFMQRDLHSKPMLSRAFLFSGPAGTGKSHMVQVFAKQMTIENTKAADGKLTLCCATNLEYRALSNTSSVQEWLFSEVAK